MQKSLENLSNRWVVEDHRGDFKTRSDIYCTDYRLTIRSRELVETVLVSGGLNFHGPPIDNPTIQPASHVQEQRVLHRVEIVCNRHGHGDVLPRRLDLTCARM